MRTWKRKSLEKLEKLTKLSLALLITVNSSGTIVAEDEEFATAEPTQETVVEEVPVEEPVVEETPVEEPTEEVYEVVEPTATEETITVEENNTEPTETVVEETPEPTPEVTDYSGSIIYNSPEYSEDHSYATVKITLQTNDDVVLSVNEVTGVTVNEDLKTPKQYVLIIDTNGTYTLNASVLDTNNNLVGSKEEQIIIDGIVETSEAKQSNGFDFEDEDEETDEGTPTESPEATEEPTGEPEEQADENGDEESEMTEFIFWTADDTVTGGATTSILLTIKPDDYPYKGLDSVTWKTVQYDSDGNEVDASSIATISEDGTVTTYTVETTENVTIVGIHKVTGNSFSYTFQVDPIKVDRIELSADATYSKGYLNAGESTTLTATITPENAVDKDLTWTSSNPDVATVDENGVVTALKQGETIITATNDASGTYATKGITVYASNPVKYSFAVWVTNQKKNTTVSINIPTDGTPVSVSSLPTTVTASGQSYAFTGTVRYLTSEQIGSDLPAWSGITNKPVIKRLRITNNQLQYSTTDDGNDWTNAESNRIVAFYGMEIATKQETVTTDTGIIIVVGDWPYGDNEGSGHNKQTLQITVYNEESNNELVYDSGTLRYDNNSNGSLGKVQFNSSQSLYEVDYVVVLKGTTEIARYTASELKDVDLSVAYSQGATNHYYIKAYVKAKTFSVTYDGNGADASSNMPDVAYYKPANNALVTVTSTPTKANSIFMGWEYNGRLYKAGDTFNMPTSDVTLTARWASASEMITYSSNNTTYGTVTRKSELINKNTKITSGSVANAKNGYRFTGWYDGETLVSNNTSFRPEVKVASYTAKFERDTSIFKVDGYTGTYDGNAHTISTSGQLVSGETRQYSTDGTNWSSELPSYVNAGTYTVYARVVNETDTIWSGNATVTITPKVVTVTAQNSSKVYGAADPSFTATVDGTLGTDTVTYTVARSNTDENVGTYSGVIVPSGEAAQGNYTVTYVKGVFTIIAKKTIDPEPENPDDKNPNYDYSVVIDDPSEYTYNGKDQTWIPSVKDKSTGELLKVDVDYTVTYSTDNRTDANDEITVIIKGIGNYTGEVKKTYKINKATLTISTGGGSKVYDGSPLTSYDYSVEGFANYETGSIVVTGSQTNAGSSKNTYTITWDGSAKKSNYTVSEDLGTLTVIAQNINPDPDPENPDSKYDGVTVEDPEDATYNGKPQENKPVVKDKNGNILVEGKDYELSYSEDTTNAGTVTVTVKGKGNYTGEVDAHYTINKAVITVVTEDGSKTYDGRALTALGTITGLVNDETVTFEVTGSQTTVGNSKNTYTITWDGTAKESNYTVDETIGTLTVTAGGSPTPTVEPDPNPGCPVGTTWNEETQRCEGVTPTPTVDPNPDPVPTVDPTPTFTPDGGEETVEPTPSATPSATTIIDGDETPLAPGTETEVKTWALVNLVASIVTVLLTIILLLSKHKKDDDEEDENREEVNVQENEENEDQLTRKRRWKFVSAIISIISVVALLLTEDFTHKMVWTDKWTILMIVIMIVNIIPLYFGRKWQEPEEEKDASENA